MRGAPQVGFALDILRIRSRTSGSIQTLPIFRRLFHAQNRRKPILCHRTTVSGVTMANAEAQSFQKRERRTQNARSLADSRGRFTLR
jgi:hypothetical protein